jgi:putative transcription factor
VSKGASAVADADYLRDSDEEIKFEKVSHECAQGVQAARLAKEMTQAQLAKAVNEKPSTIVDIEAGTARYNADTINRIEKVLGVKINRGRKSGGRKKKKNPPGGF